MKQSNNKEDILRAAQKDRDLGKEYENRVFSKSISIASIISLFVAAVLFFVEYFANKTWNIGLLAVALTTSTVQILYEGTVLKSFWKRIIGFVEAIILILLIIVFIGQTIL